MTHYKFISLTAGIVLAGAGILTPLTSVLASGVSPTIDAGPNKTLVFPAKDLTLFGHATDPENDPLNIQWTMTSGPASVTYSNAKALATTVSFTTPGTYTFQLSVNDGTNTVTANTTATVLSADSATSFYVDPTYTGGSSDGSMGRPWTAIDHSKLLP